MRLIFAPPNKLVNRVENLIRSLKTATLTLAFLLGYSSVIYLIWGKWDYNLREYAVLYVGFVAIFYFFDKKEGKL